MSTLREIVHNAIDQADDRWQHGIAGDPEKYTQELSDAAVAALVEASGGPDHIISLSGSDWTLQHPINERFEGSLLDCKHTQTAPLVAQIVSQAEGDGRFRVWIERNAFQWERTE